MERFNERFAVVAAKSEDLHRSLSVRGSRLKDILCHREQRHVSEQLALSYDRKQIILERSPVSEELGGQYVELYNFPDRPLEVRWKVVSLPYRVFEKDRRVIHAAVVENKRLGHALAFVKLQQELRHDTKVKTNSEKDGYKKRPRQIYGPNFVEKPLAPKAVKMTLEITFVISHIPTARRLRNLY